MVAAESYFQHAEHYNRIIMATQSQMSVPNSHQSEGHNASGGFRPRWNAGGHGAEICDRRDGGRNMPGLGREHGRPEGANGNEGNHDANGSGTKTMTHRYVGPSQAGGERGN
jgi:hypothetical protein